MIFVILAAILLFSSFALTAILTAVVKKKSLAKGFVSQPCSERYSSKTIALGGGIAIFACLAFFLVSSIATVKFLAVPGYLDWLGNSVTIHIEGFLGKVNELIVVLCCLFALFLLGLLDDKKFRLIERPFFKLIVQFAVALVAAGLADIRVEFFIENKIITTVLSATWIVLIINAFNFLDNMDGAAAGIAIITSCILFTAAALSGQVFIGAMALVFIGTLAGFLLFNFPPAKIFMGDAGSLVIGFFVALLTLRTTYYHQAQSGQWYPVFLPIVVMAVPLYDFISVTILRISQGKSPFVGDTQHFSHRLKRHGLTDTQIALVLYLATLCTGLGGTFLYQVNLAGAILIFVQTFMILAIIAVFEAAGKNDKSKI